MNRRLLILLMTLATGLVFAVDAEKEQRLVVRGIDTVSGELKNPSDKVSKLEEGISSALDKAPEVIDKVATAIEKVPKITDKVASAVDKLMPNKSHLYVRMGVTDSYPPRGGTLIPGVGLGYRLATGDSAIDFSASYTRGRGMKRGEKTEFLSLPKVAYLYYFAPTKARSLYIAPGVAFGRVKTKEKNRFEGIILSGSVGYELSPAFFSFVQLDVSQPVLASKLKGKLPTPITEMSFGAGF